MSITRLVSLVLPLVLALSSAHAQETPPADPPFESEAEAEALAEDVKEAAEDALDEELEDAAETADETADEIIADVLDEEAEAAIAEPAEWPEVRAEVQAPLMREGSRVNGVRGRVERDPTTGLWQFEIPAPAGAPAQALVLLPCRLLEELEATVAAAPDREPKFLVTGQVYTFQQQNYLLLLHPPQLTGASIAPTREPAPTVAPGEERAEDIIRSLEREVGPIVPRPPANQTTPVDARREGTNIVERRGQIRRTRSGAYVFVFDADRFGLADPPLIILPCQLLERFGPVDRGSRWREGSVLLTGEVLMYRGTRYVIPRAIRAARNVTLMDP